MWPTESVVYISHFVNQSNQAMKAMKKADDEEAPAMKSMKARPLCGCDGLGRKGLVWSLRSRIMALSRLVS